MLLSLKDITTVVTMGSDTRLHVTLSHRRLITQSSNLLKCYVSLAGLQWQVGIWSTSRQRRHRFPCLASSKEMTCHLICILTCYIGSHGHPSHSLAMMTPQASIFTFLLPGPSPNMNRWLYSWQLHSGENRQFCMMAPWQQTSLSTNQGST